MTEVAADERFRLEGKMLGVLVGDDVSGRPTTLRAFSGMLAGEPHAPGYVGPTRSGRLTAEAEEETLATLSLLSDRIAAVGVESARLDLQRALAPFEEKLAHLESARLANKKTRGRERAELARSRGEDVSERLAELDALSRGERREIRLMRREREEIAAPHRRRLAELQARKQSLRRERKRRSHALQEAMHAAHGLVNFAGTYAPLRELFGDLGIPSGAGECCAPKLLHEAALRGIRPRGMAEFWWGPSPPDGSRLAGEFYGACEEKCAPILGHLLCGAESPRSALPILFEDDSILVVDKPSGLLSVPGRSSAARDCVESRLHLLRPEEPYLRAVHRLDQATSGVLVLARTAESHRALSQAFAERKVAKSYEAVVAGGVAEDSGIIDLPLRPDPTARPRQVVDHGAGKPAVTHYRVRDRGVASTRLILTPTTGRTHQLRVHCASPEGLGAPILGDPLYGDASSAPRLMLHAARLELVHPVSGQAMVFESASGFG